MAVYQRIKTPKGWRYRRVRLGPGRRPAEAPPYYIRFTVGGKQQWSVPYPSLAKAIAAEKELPDAIEAQQRGISLGELQEARNANRVPITDAVADYLELKSDKAPKTRAQYQTALSGFVESLGDKIHFLDEITPDTLRGYKRFMEAKGYAGKTIHTRLNIVFFMLKKRGVAARIPRDEMPTVEVEDAKRYSDEELKRLFAAMTPEEQLRYKFFLGTGCRDREVTFAAWDDIDFEKSMYHVRGKADAGFTPKSHESREVPLPRSLLSLLKARRKNAPRGHWVFTNRDGNPENHFLRRLKKIALRAGLNCGQCHTEIAAGRYYKTHKQVTCKTHPVCERHYLHRFRKTCATRWHENNIPLRTIQRWLGHKSLATTQRYLAPTEADKLRDQIDAAFGD